MKPLVLLHGWGMTPSVFGPLRRRLESSHDIRAIPLPGYDGMPRCEPYLLQTVARAVAQAAPEHCAVIGWSLGAQVALEWARTAPQQVMRLVLIGATPCFIQRSDWVHAIAPHVLSEFAGLLAFDRECALERFASLQARGDRKLKIVARALRARTAASIDASLSTLEQGLDILSSVDLRGTLQAVAQDVLVVHGSRDALVPLAAGEYLARTLPRADLRTIGGAAHAPFIAHADIVAAAIEAFLE